MKRYIIIGGGIAGVSCVEGIRSVDAEGTITLISAEQHSNYGRPLISYYLEGKTDVARMSYRGADFYEKNGVRVLHGVRVERIDAADHRVVLADAAVLEYDALCLCTGSHPVVPKFEGLDTVERRFTFTTLADALALEQTVTKDSRVLVIGAGFIGLKCAEGLRDRAGSVTVCDMAEHVMPANLDADSAAILQRHLEANGVRLILGDSVKRFHGDTARLQSGAEVKFDVLVIAAGVRPETALFTAAGGEAGRGIPVDETMKTALPDVWAAGDCTESVDLTTGKADVLAVLPNACMGGRCAGANMAGGAATFDKGVKMNSIGFFGLHLMSAGTYTEPAYSEVTETACKKLFASRGVLTGFILVGDVARAGIYTAMIRNKTPLAEIDFEAVKRNPSLLPFGKSYRAQKLGGVV